MRFPAPAERNVCSRPMALCASPLQRCGMFVVGQWLYAVPRSAAVVHGAVVPLPGRRASGPKRVITYG